MGLGTSDMPPVKHGSVSDFALFFMQTRQQHMQHRQHTARSRTRMMPPRTLGMTMYSRLMAVGGGSHAGMSQYSAPTAPPSSMT